MEKIQVVFNLDQETLKKLITEGEKGPKTISKKDLEEMSSKGMVHAADYFSIEQERAVIGAISKFVRKVGSKASSKLSNKTTQRVVITEAANIVADKLSTAPTATIKKDRPKK